MTITHYLLNYIRIFCVLDVIILKSFKKQIIYKFIYKIIWKDLKFLIYREKNRESNIQTSLILLINEKIEL